MITRLLRIVIAALVLFLAMAVVLGCAGTELDARHFDYGKLVDPRTREYVIGDGDLLQISVWKNSELSTEVRVRPDGTITLPLIGDLEARGRTPTELLHEIRDRLKHWLRRGSAVVTVSVLEVKSYQVSVNGEVQHPGLFASSTYMTVLDAIAMAGGLTRFAEGKAIVVLRRGKDGQVKKIPIDFRSLISGERPEMNIVLMAGDAVVVP